MRMNRNIKLVALDLDGTFLNEKKEVTEGNRKAILEASKVGVQAVVSTGRPYTGFDVEDFLAMGMEYAITVNGAEIYRLADRKCMYEEGMDKLRACEIIDELKKFDIRIDVLVEGSGYGEKAAHSRIDEIGMPEVMRNYIRETRKLVDNLQDFIREKATTVPKITLNFYLTEEGEYKDYEKVVKLLEGMEDISFLSGGYHNLEITKKGVNKGKSLRILAEMLGVDMKETMACGDSENDIDILKAAGIGVAMANASEVTKEAADYVTLSNEEDGVAHAIYELVLRER